jgi:glucose/arabinose dehydrogenase
MPIRCLSAVLAATLALALALAAALALGLVLARPLAAQEQTAVMAHVVRPRIVAATPERIGSLRVPEGFTVSVFAEGLGKPRMIAAAPDGAVYVTRREPGDLWLLRDADGDGKAEHREAVLTRKDLHGVAVEAETIYLVAIREALVAPRKADGTLGPPRTIANGLPDAGQHPNRTIALGPDGKAYLSVGSTCNACREPNPESATLLRLAKGGGTRERVATGLRNTIGFDWHPATGALWGVDHGIDYLGDDEQKEELNRIEEGEDYGWPYAYADGQVYQAIEPPPDGSKEERAAKSRKPALLLVAHSAPMQMAFYAGEQFPERFRGGAFVTLHGSWNRKPPSGYEVVFVRFDAAGEPTGLEPFLTGFLAQDGEEFTAFGRPCGLAVMPDGSLLVGDDANGVVYRVSASAARRSAVRR